MSVTIFGLKTCDTCRKARKALPEAQFKDVRAEPLTAEERAAFLHAFGDTLINRSSTTWRGLSEEEREMSPDILLEKYPTLVKRPVIRQNDTLFLGWNEKTHSALGVV